MQIIGVASGCDWAENLIGMASDGFGQAACPGKVFLGGKFVTNGQGKMSVMDDRPHTAESLRHPIDGGCRIVL